MGQKVNPHELRVKIGKGWESSQWYDEKNNENMDSVKELYKLSKKIDDSATKQFTKRVMQKIAKRLVLPRQRLLA